MVKKKKKPTKAEIKKKEAKKKRIELRKMDVVWKTTIKMSDNWTCQICKKYLKETPHNCHAHHILDKKNYPEFRHHLVNGITLCYRCHKVGRRSPHMDALWFSSFMKRERPKQYEYLLEKVKEINLTRDSELKQSEN